MMITTLIKEEFGRIKDMTVCRAVIALLAGVLIPSAAAAVSVVSRMSLSPVMWMLVFVFPFASVFLFYSMIPKPKRSVFFSVRILYYITAPFFPVLLTSFLFEPYNSEIYSESFFSRFLPVWAAIWLLGTAAVYVLMRLIEYVSEKGRKKNCLASRLTHSLAVMYTPQKVTSKQKSSRKGKWAIAAACMLMVSVGVLIGTVTVFLYCVYSNMEFEAILFTMRFAAGGLAIEDIISGTAIFIIFVSISGYLCFHILKCFRNDKITVTDSENGGDYTLVMSKKKRAFIILLSALLMTGGIAVFSAQTGFIHYIYMKSGKSDIYETHYVTPDDSVLSFPENKNNLIYIYVESMENSYASKNAGGSMDKNYISELTKLTQDSDSVSFSNTDRLGGPSVFVPSITYTMGSTVAQTSGISLNTHLLLHNTDAEFPNVITLEDILHDNGYNRLYIEGSKGEFSMYDKYVGRYEDSMVFDRKTAADNGYTDESADYMWKWGIEDRKLFDITKELITDISQSDKPFFVTMYTMDTHSFECGHRCPDCDSIITNDYLASVDCTSRAVSRFVEWVKQQPFYDNTTIILIGDHLGNKKTSMVDIDEDYLRTTYNCIINPAKKALNTQNRVFSSLDMFPTTLSAIGVQIKGDRLGLGTDLFSGTKTLCEELGEEKYKAQLEQDSDYYNNKFYD